jgi:replication factor A2
VHTRPPLRLAWHRPALLAARVPPCDRLSTFKTQLFFPPATTPPQKHTTGNPTQQETTMDAYANYANDARAFAGGGGGGFMPSQPADQFGGGGGAFGGGGGSALKRSGGGGEGGKREVSTLRALTVRQLLRGQQQADDAQAASDRVSVDGADVHNATLLGKVMSVQEGGQRTTLTLHDGTGMIEVSKWRMDDDAQGVGQGSRVAVGSYVRVFGHLRAGGGGGGGGRSGGGAGGAGGGNLSFHAFAVRPVTDHNEVTYHLLQCAFQHAHLTRGGPGTGKGGFAAAGGQQQQQQPAYGVGAYGGAALPAAAAPAAAGAGAHQPGSLQEAITAVLSDPSVGENGLHVNEVVQRVRAAAAARGGGPHAAASLADVQAALSALMNEALAYTTVDDSHWKST